MINDYQTNMVYLAHGLSHYVPVCRNLLEALHREQIHAEFLPYTSSYKHVWARDYMPIQIEKTLVFFYEYWTDYLLGYDGYIPNVLEIIDHLHLGRIPVDYVLDGGNFVKCGDKVIMTDKIFQENDWVERKELLSALEDYLQVQIIIIPWDRYEIFSHSDGMVQWIDGNRVLMNNYINTDPDFRKKLLEALTPHFIVEELEFNTPRLNKLSWAYLNFLRVKNVSLYLAYTRRKTRWLCNRSSSSTRIAKSSRCKDVKSWPATAAPCIVSHGMSLPMFTNGPKKKHKQIKAQYYEEL